MESSRKPMINGESLFQELTNYVLGEVQKTNLPYFHFTENEQKGQSFGERFIHAIQTVFEKGFENIITVGNDTPELKTTHLVEARKQLEKGNAVLGPSLDGGFYLMGINRKNFNPETFIKLPWQRSNLFKYIWKVLKNTDCSIIKLTRLKDIDIIYDIKFFLGFKKSISKTVLKLLRQIVNSFVLIFDKTKFLLNPLVLQQDYNKGSPVFLLT